MRFPWFSAIIMTLLAYLVWEPIRQAWAQAFAPTSGQYNSTAPSLTTGQFAVVQMDSSGNLKVNIAAGSSSGPSGSYGAAMNASGVPIGCEYLSSAPSDTASGDMYACLLDSGGNLLIDLMKVNGSAFALGQTTMSASLPVTIASNQTNVPVASQAATTGGASVYNAWPAPSSGVLSTTAATVKSAAGTVYNVYCDNTANNTATYVVLINATSITWGTTVPIIVMKVPALGVLNEPIPIMGIAFAADIGIANSTSLSSSAAPTTGVSCSVNYD